MITSDLITIARAHRIHDQAMMKDIEDNVLGLKEDPSAHTALPLQGQSYACRAVHYIDSFS